MLLDTPAGTQATLVLSRWGKVLRKREINEHFAPSFLEKISPLKVRGITLSMKVMLPVEIGASEGDDLQLVVELTTKQGPMSLRIKVDADPPHRILGLSIRPPGLTVAEALRDATADRDLDQLLAEKIGTYAESLKGDGVGASCAIYHKGATTVRAFGNVLGDSIFEIGSITKVVTAALLADMVAKGEVRLEGRVAEQLPPDASMPSGGEDITYLELASHTSGLPRLPVNLVPPDMSDPYSTFTIDALLDGLATTSITDRGSDEYSNLGYALLGQLLARIADVPYEDLVRTRIFGPIEMKDSYFEDVPDTRRVPGHSEGGGVPYWNLAAVSPAGGIRATASDVLRFSVARATSNDRNVSLGWVVEQTPNGEVLWHNGGTGGFLSFTGFHRDSATAIAVLTNTSDGEGPSAVAASVLGSLVASL